MSLLKSALIISLFSFGSAHADIYKCVINGKTTFSQRPCAADAEIINVQVSKPSQEAVDRANTATEFNKKYAQDSDREVAIRNLKRKNAGLHKDITQFQENMDAEIASAKLKKQSAANNLAGATWEQSISSEMAAVASKYQVKIDQANLKISRNEDEIELLEAEAK